MKFDLEKYPPRLHYDIVGRNVELLERFGPFAERLGVTDLPSAEQRFANAVPDEKLVANYALRAARAAERLRVIVVTKPFAFAYGDSAILQRAARWNTDLRRVLANAGTFAEAAAERLMEPLSPATRELWEAGLDHGYGGVVNPTGRSVLEVMGLGGKGKGGCIIAFTLIAAGLLLHYSET